VDSPVAAAAKWGASARPDVAPPGLGFPPRAALAFVFGDLDMIVSFDPSL